MFRGIDRSTGLARLIERLSAGLARRRGLPIILGILLIFISFIIQLVDYRVGSRTLALLWTITHHVGLILALIGILLVEPLGK
jgi:hypothetical protein